MPGYGKNKTVRKRLQKRWTRGNDNPIRCGTHMYRYKSYAGAPSNIIERCDLEEWKENSKKAHWIQTKL